ncbi:MAG: hypothetical protein JO010_13855 [Alphaproteobacteria bacterium]|nr:hypothetical protein [Alphaproteobacteria bacterium]
MDFIFMLTRDDRTVPDCLDMLEEIADLGLRHIGFKDIGVPHETLIELNRRIKAMGAASYLEVVSLSPEACLTAGEQARAIGVDCLLGGADAAGICAAVAGTAIRFFPFVGTPEGHPTKLRGDAARIAEDCRRSEALGCAGIDLLAYRAVEAMPLDLIREARAALRGRLIVAGSIDTPQRVAELAAAGVDAFTIGTALLAHRFAPDRPSLRGQLAEVIGLCG